MHKFFAKTLFLGKKVIFLPECHSTNESLSNLCKIEFLPEGTVVWSDYQTKGRGQRGNGWESIKGKNLLASVLLRPKWLTIADQFYLTFISGLAIRKSIQERVKMDVKVKWPNDVYVREKKIAGILTEASISSRSLDSAVVGFGINLNQDEFQNQAAVSIYNLINEVTDREELLSAVLRDLEYYLMKLKAGKSRELLEEYFENMLGYGEIRTFAAKGEFQGKIVGVDSKGCLEIMVHTAGNTSLIEGARATFGLKEISMLLQ
ncbi:MAG: biotin--[acetyl-CoA-carboxylase] ligase [Cyclobacteriaceae bacterium]